MAAPSVGATDAAPKTLAQRRAQTQNGRQALWTRFLREADPDGSLPEDERIARATELRRQHMQAAARRGAELRFSGEEARRREQRQAKRGSRT